MPKDPTENIARYKIRGGHLNEFEYTQHHGELEREGRSSGESEGFIPGTPPQVAAERTKKLIERITQKMHPDKRAQSGAGAKRSGSRSGAQRTATKAAKAKAAGSKSASTPAKKTAAKSAAKRSASAVALSSTRSPSKKSAAKKGGAASKTRVAKKK
jgi:hypothetical protein